MAEQIILDEELFEDSFLPEKLEGRESQIKEIARCLSPTKVGRFIKNVYLHGPPGVGKTSVIKWIMKEHFPRNSAYVNCWSKRTTHKILEEILHQQGLVIHGKEPTSELVRRFENLKRKIIVCLDECDHLKDFDILYLVARNSCALILISNEAYVLSRADQRTMSSLFIEEFSFQKYTNEEVLDILKNRARCGINPNALSEGLLSIIAKISNGDSRIGLQTLHIAAREAETSDQPKITLEDVKKGAKCTRKYKLSYVLGKLTDNQRKIFNILKENRKMPSGKLLEEFRKQSKTPVIDRSYRNHMHRMVDLGLVKQSKEGRWKEYEVVI